MRAADGRPVLNIGRMAPGSQGYYLAVVAHRAQDYYLAPGEEPGRWLGDGAARLGLAGQVDGESLGRVLAGRHPDDGSRLAAHPARRVPGFDLTMRAPKSVSLLWGLADRDTASEVVAAHDAAVDAAIGYLQRTACQTRRGAGGAEQVEGGGLVAAGFRHRASRADDPLLHTHVLVANLTETVDDHVWRTLDSKRLFAHAKTAGFLYQAQLRHELAVRLGVTFGPVEHGHADLAGVPRDWIEGFSRRRTQILEQLAERGETSAKAAQVATLATRRPKPATRSSEAQLRARWATRARQLEIPADWTRHVLNRATPARPDIAGLLGRPGDSGHLIVM